MADTTHVPLRSAAISQFIDGVYGLVNPQVGTTRQGKPYLKCILRDASGEMPGRKWDFPEADLGALSATGFVRVAGGVESYDDRAQLRIERIHSVEVADEDLARLLPVARRDPAAMDARLREILGTLAHPGMRALVEEYLADDELMARFRRAPAAVTLHHAWIGGLLEHTLQLVELADRMLPLYPLLSRDLVLAGLFLHDIGKVFELSWERGFNYTVDGNLIGHIVRGAILLQAKAARVRQRIGEELPADAIKVLQHIILSHHGRPEHGAARMPSTPEAIFVASLDHLDARTQMALSATREEGAPDAGGALFTDRLWALETRLYRPDPLAASMEAPATAAAPPPEPAVDAQRGPDGAT
ncbi:MAG TPA: HD domain-containing protein [Phycisphaerales bacterium]|nr:HD domain-containing protein [Phycisphaerales bacterium]HMP36449.1 HD domain-containing protein [Phycisphaerales bacterium]